MPIKTYTVAYLGSIFKKIIQEKDSFNKIKFIERYKKSFIKHYIFDLLDKPFKTSSSKTAYNLMVNDKYYEEKLFILLKVKLIIILKNQKLKKMIRSIMNQAYLISYLYGRSITTTENSNKIFENDHLIPKSILKRNKITGKSSFANLSIIFNNKNRKKSDKMSLDFLENEPLSIWAKTNDDLNYDELKKFIQL